MAGTWTRDAQGNFLYQATPDAPPVAFSSAQLSPDVQQKIVAQITPAQPTSMPAGISAENSPPISPVVGPPRAGSVYDLYGQDELARHDRALSTLEAAKSYQAAYGTPGARAQDAPAFQEVAGRGGITPEEALHMSRYRAWRKGVQNVPAGDKVQPRSPEDIAARGQQFVAASPDERGQMMAQDKSAYEPELEQWFDSLTPKQQKAAEKEADKAS